jgi:hypothetical protein
MPRQFVRCCEETAEGDYGNVIYLDEKAGVFRYALDDQPFQYCPFCGVLLDMNLPMTEE